MDRFAVDDFAGDTHDVTVLVESDDVRGMLGIGSGVDCEEIGGGDEIPVTPVVDATDSNSGRLSECGTEGCGTVLVDEFGNSLDSEEFLFVVAELEDWTDEGFVTVDGSDTD